MAVTGISFFLNSKITCVAFQLSGISFFVNIDSQRKQGFSKFSFLLKHLKVFHCYGYLLHSVPLGIHLLFSPVRLDFSIVGVIHSQMLIFFYYKSGNLIDESEEANPDGNCGQMRDAISGQLAVQLVDKVFNEVQGHTRLASAFGPGLCKSSKRKQQLV